MATRPELSRQDSSTFWFQSEACVKCPLAAPFSPSANQEDDAPKAGGDSRRRDGPGVGFAAFLAQQTTGCARGAVCDATRRDSSLVVLLKLLARRSRGCRPTWQGAAHPYGSSHVPCIRHTPIGLLLRHTRKLSAPFCFELVKPSVRWHDWKTLKACARKESAQKRVEWLSRESIREPCLEHLAEDRAAARPRTVEAALR